MRVWFECFGLSVLLETSSFSSPRTANESAPDSIESRDASLEQPSPKCCSRPLYVLSLIVGMAPTGHGGKCERLGALRGQLSTEFWQRGLVLYAARPAVLLLSRYSRKNSFGFASRITRHRGTFCFALQSLPLSILFRNRNRELIPQSAAVVRAQIGAGCPRGILRPASVLLPEAGPVECQPANHS